MKKLLWIFTCIALGHHLSNGQVNCTPTFLGGNVFIDNFAFHDLVNMYSDVDSDEYVFYPNSMFTTTVTMGRKYPITISCRYPAGIIGKFAAWIDYNNDSLFDHTELIHYDSISQFTTSGFVSIPSDTSYIGQRRLRVIYAWYPNTVIPCDHYDTGEAEDYWINIVSNQPDSLTYCMPFNPPGISNFIINHFHVGYIVNNNSGADSTGYTFNHSNQFFTNLYLDSTYPISISKGITAGSTGGYAVWIDLNDDGDFSNSERLFYAGPGLTSANGFITIPNDTSFVGIHRLRVRSRSGTVPTNPCGLYPAGETEDYLVNLLPKNALSVHEPNVNPGIRIFPNPSSGQFNVTSGRIMNEVIITNLLGQVVYAAMPNANQTVVQISNPGEYYLRITSFNTSSIHKLRVDN